RAIEPDCGYGRARRRAADAVDAHLGKRIAEGCGCGECRPDTVHEVPKEERAGVVVESAGLVQAVDEHGLAREAHGEPELRGEHVPAHLVEDERSGAA